MKTAAPGNSTWHVAIGPNKEEKSLVARIAVESLVIAFFLLCALPPFAHAELHQGEGYVSGLEGGWDFSAFGFVPYLDADLSTHVMLVAGQQGNGLEQFLLSAGGIQYAPLDVPFDSLIVAPTEGYAENQVATGYQYMNYFVRTREGHYAKIQMQAWAPSWPFRYSYQDDGTPILSIRVAVKNTTWGRIKALYR